MLGGGLGTPSSEELGGVAKQRWAPSEMAKAVNVRVAKHRVGDGAELTSGSAHSSKLGLKCK